jgi:hypothetical protein
MLKVKHLFKTFGVGRNGRGKTTLTWGLGRRSIERNILVVENVLQKWHQASKI